MKEYLKQRIIASVENDMKELLEIKQYLYENPEVGGTEVLASARLIQFLKDRGFCVTSPVIDIPYSFRAEYDSGKPGATIGLTAEYDALPEIGHGCGHNIICTTSLGAANALKKVVSEVGGKVIVYGTPGEENVCSKVAMSREGVFNEVDVIMTAHPNGKDIVSGKTTAIDAWQADFYGKSAHAGAHPEEGINALDAAVYFYNLVGFEKQYLPNTNIYGIFGDAGQKCSVIPDHASVKYLVRTKSMKDMDKVRAMLERCAEGASRAVGTTHKLWNNEPPNMDMVTNQTLSEVFTFNYEEVSGHIMAREDNAASTDMGDASHVVPAIHPWIGLNAPDVMLHSREFAELSMTQAGDDAVKYGAEALALTGVEVLIDPELLAQIKEEFRQTFA